MESQTPRKSGICPSDTACWTDPRDGASSTGGQSGSAFDDYGIVIPFFLQPLLGLDFVPYLPRSLPTSPASLDGIRLTDEDMDDLDLMREAAGRESASVPLDVLRDTTSRSHSSSVSPILEPTSEELAEIEYFLNPPPSGESSKENSTRSPSSRRSWRPTGRFIKKVRGKRGRRAMQRGKRLDGTGTWHNGKEQDMSHPSNVLGWFQEQHLRLENSRIHLEKVQSEANAMETRTAEIGHRLGQSQSEIANLQEALNLVEQRLRHDVTAFGDAKSQLSRLQAEALKASQAVVDTIRQMEVGRPSSVLPGSTSNDIHPSDVIELNLDGTPKGMCPNLPLQISSQMPLRQRASTAPPAARVESFMRVHDLNMSSTQDASQESSAPLRTSLSRLSLSSSNISSNNSTTNGFIFVDSNIAPILENLTKLGYQIAVDESTRFEPTRDTERYLANYQASAYTDNELNDWPVSSWKLAHGSDILVWTGDIGHTGFGCDWPVVKARGLVNTSPESLVKFMMDSSRIKEYSKMSQGREDLIRIQQGLNTTAVESLYGFAGDCKIIRALNKPRFLPRTIETLSLTYSRPLATSTGSYMTVIRSVFEDDSGEHKSRAANTIRSEMLLGVLLFRPANKSHSVCEFTTVTHVFSPGVPEILARRIAPSSAYSMMKDIQSVFSTK